MSRVPLVALLAVTAGTVAAGAWQQPRFRAGTNTVSVFATVQDGTGRLVPDLTRDDFEVLDNGKPQPLTVFANDVQPITIVIMLDRSGSMMWNFGLVRDAAEQFVGDLLPEDRARIGNFSNRVQIDPETFTSDRKELVRILHENLQDAGPTPLWNATSAAMNALESQSGRRVVLVFTDGKDSPPNPTGNATFWEVRDRSQKDEIMVYAIGLANSCGLPSSPAPATSSQSSGALFQRRGGIPRGPTIRIPIGGRIGFPPMGIPRIEPPPPPVGMPKTPPSDPASTTSGSGCTATKPDPNLAELAAVGGGGYFELRGTDNLTTTFKRIAEELHHQYLLAFTAEALDGKTHTLEVRLRQPGLTARSRKSYVAASDK
ncbi:MAG TPA: VWA domain-containing protein [Vicinamibacterales bacterium]|nr:VWA domain-containing protein [Vicinamibacterales bacterium]